MDFIKRLFKKNPQQDFLLGRDAFAEKSYNKALRHFEKAFSGFSDLKMKSSSIVNAATSAEYAENYGVASKYYYQSVLLKLQAKDPTSDVLKNIEKSYYLSRKIDKSPLNVYKLLYLRYITLLSLKDIKGATAIVPEYDSLVNDEHFAAIRLTNELIHSDKSFDEKTNLPFVKRPKEFDRIFNDASKYITGISACRANISLSTDTSIEKGEKFSVTGEIKAFILINIKEIILKTGTRGNLVDHQSSAPKMLGKGDSHKESFGVVPLLSGNWELGPLVVRYSLESDDKKLFEIHSDTINVSIREAKPSVDLDLKVVTVEEDFEYELIISVKNNGLTAVNDLKIITEIPERIEIKQGFPEKLISGLNEQQSFDFSVFINLPVEREKGESFKITAIAQLENKEQLKKSSVLIQV